MRHSTHVEPVCRLNLGGVYMIPRRLSHRREFTPVPSLSSVFVYMISPKKVMLGRPTPARVHPSCCTGAKISFRREISQRTTTRSGVKSDSRWAGTGSTCVPFLIDAIFAIWIHACILSTYGVPSGKHDTNSPRHHVNDVSRSPRGVKLAQVRVSHVNTS